MVLQQMVQQQVVQPKVILSAPAAKTVKSVDLLKNPAAWVAAFGAGTPIDSGELVNRYIDTPWLNQGIEKRAKALANMPYAFLDQSGEQITDHTDFDSDKLGINFNFSHLLDEHEGDLLLYGAAYAIVEMNQFGMNKQLRRLHPSTIQPIYSDIGELTHFERRVNGRGYNIPKEAMVYVWNTNRRHENGPGIPSAMSALLAAGLLHSIDEHGTNFFENGAVNPTLIQIEGYEQLAEPDKAAVRKWFTRMFGRGNGGGERVIPLGKNVEVKQAGDSMDKLAVPELTDKKREDISTALGVPQSLLFSNATNFATAEADRLSFYDFTVVPRAKQLQNAYNEQLFKALGIELKFKPDELEIYQQQEGKKSDRLAIMYDRGVIDTNEYREMMDMDPYSDENISRLREAQNRLSNSNSGQPDNTDGMSDSMSNSIGDELRAWERKAKKRFKEGSPQKALDFDAEHIPATLVESIKGQIEGLNDDAHLGLIFNDARQYAALLH